MELVNRPPNRLRFKREDVSFGDCDWDDSISSIGSSSSMLIRSPRALLSDARTIPNGDLLAFGLWARKNGDLAGVFVVSVFVSDGTTVDASSLSDWSSSRIALVAVDAFLIFLGVRFGVNVLGASCEAFDFGAKNEFLDPDVIAFGLDTV